MLVDIIAVFSDDIFMGYFGGKSGAGVYQKIINIMPPHHTYLEPFLGAGAVMRHKKPAVNNIGVDLDSKVINEWHSGSYIVKNSDTSGDIAKDSDRIPPRFQFIKANAFNFLESYQFLGNELVYLDPPYLHETRGATRYKYELTTLDHRILLEAIKTLPCMVIISGYFSDLYADLLGGWNSLSFEAMTRSGKTATEWLWFNFEWPIILHDYGFLGDNFRERERIKRKKDRWVSRINKMSILEKRALLQALALTDMDDQISTIVAMSADTTENSDTAASMEMTIPASIGESSEVQLKLLDDGSPRFHPGNRRG